MLILPLPSPMSGSLLQNGRRRNALEFEHFNFILSVRRPFIRHLVHQRIHHYVFFRSLPLFLQSQNITMRWILHRIYLLLLNLCCLLRLLRLLQHLRFGGVLELIWDNALNCCFKMKYLMPAFKPYCVPIKIKS